MTPTDADSPPGASPVRAGMEPVSTGLQALRVSGADAETFLQGQLSSDLRELTPARAQWSSWNSPKGRMLAFVLLVRDGDAVDLWMPAGLVPAIHKRLRMFVLRSKVTVDDLGAGRGALGLVGARAADALAAAHLPVPSEPRAVAAGDGAQVLRTLGTDPRYLVLGSPGVLAAAPSPDALAWRAGDIDAGLPTVFPETQDRWVAQMANLDQFGAIGFEKGCYTGQEVVARLHYLGNLKKRMFRLAGDGPAPVPGAAIHVAGGDGQSVGDIVDAVAASGGGFVASAVLQVAQASSAALVVGSARCSIPVAYRY